MSLLRSRLRLLHHETNNANGAMGRLIMYHAKIWQCKGCMTKIELDAMYDAAPCHCGNEMVLVGESYDQEFVDQERYERQQDYEYEKRHGY